MNRFRIDRIIAKPKELFFAEQYQNHSIEIKDKDQLKALEYIIDAIENGYKLPDRFYRQKGTHDYLLNGLGVMHLHLGNSKSNELLYLIQYEDSVIFLELNTHIHTNQGKPWEILKARHKEVSKLNNHTPFKLEPCLEKCSDAGILKIYRTDKSVECPICNTEHIISSFDPSQYKVA